MLYLSGAISQQAVGEPGLGWLLTPNMGNRLPSTGAWGADNGCFTQPHTYSDERYLAWLAKMAPASGRCLFATAPDVVGDAAATLARSLPMLPRLRSAGYLAALVAQDGLEDEQVPWQAFDVLFIGGSTEWKMGPECAALITEAKARGKLVHVGRVNSAKRFRHFAALGADSADGTFLAFGPAKNLPKLRSWLAEEATRLAQLLAPPTTPQEA